MPTVQLLCGTHGLSQMEQQLANRPYLILYYKKDKTCLLIDIDIPDYSNFNTKETEKLNKYKDLEVEVSRMWKVSIKIVPIIIGAL
jgi:hypothetical protein